MTQTIVEISWQYSKSLQNCKLMLVINKFKYYCSYLFRDYIKGEYEKIYQLSKKKAMHSIICNYDIE
jgi:hypothetical protein